MFCVAKYAERLCTAEREKDEREREKEREAKGDAALSRKRTPRDTIMGRFLR